MSIEPYCYNLGQRFAAIAARYADRTALWFERGRTLSYRDLDRLSDRLAAALVEGLGLVPGDVVCLAGDKSVWSYAGLIACLKVGCPYAFVDPDSPVDRLARIFGTCQPKLVLGDRVFLDGLRTGTGVTDARLEQPERLADHEAAGPVDLLAKTNAVTGEQAAYIMYTSGSTGIPKGAVMTHANVMNLIGWSRTTYAITGEDRLTNVNPLYFDNSVFDIYSALFNGATLVPFTRAETRDPGALVGKIDDLQCTVWFSVPSLLMFLQTVKATDGKHLRSLTRCIFGGEGYPKGKLVQLFRTYGDTMELHNVYGPTECTCICSSYRLTAADFADLNGLPPLGSLAPNFGGLIVGDDGRPTPDGDVGELCLLGPNVGKGYYRDPERTAAAFVQNPANPAYREVMYRTGDLARRDPRDGKLYIHGRRDNQIKHMGYRIELEEIEAALHRLEYVAQAVVVHTTRNGLSRLVAWVALKAAATTDRLLDDLRGLVPDYMIPGEIRFLTELPKNANGKVDRRLLREEVEGGGLEVNR